MASSPQTDCKSSRAARATLAKPLAPEEIRPGDFVTPLFVVSEWPSYWWRIETWDRSPEEPVRIRFTLSSYQGAPLKVRSVCLPFVLVKAADGEQSTLDLRTFQLARLDRSYAKRVWKARRKGRRKKSECVAPGVV